MGIVLLLLSVLLGIVAFICGLIIIIDAFKNEVWKGVLGFFCFLYLLYYAFVEYDSPSKMQIIAGWLGGGILAGALYGVGAVSALNAIAPAR